MAKSNATAEACSRAPDLEHAKAADLNHLTSASRQPTNDRAIHSFVACGLRQNRRRAERGHQRTVTRPSMYSRGTKPQ
jgi:hypothetical protein